MTAQTEAPVMHLNAFLIQIKNKSDRMINYFLISFFLGGLLLAFFYDTWEVAIGVGGLSLVAYYSAKLALPRSNLYQYVLSAVFGMFMAQYIYQMHGLFEMHFVAFIGSAILITYQNWKLQIPIALLVVVHHALFGYLQYVGYDKIYFTQLEYMSLQTFIIHALLAAVIFFISGLWAHHFRKYSTRHIEQTFRMGRLEEERRQREALLALSDSLKLTNERLTEAQQIAGLGSWTWDVVSNTVHRSDEFYNILQRDPSDLNGTPESFLRYMHPEDVATVNPIVKQSVAERKPFSYEARMLMPDGGVKFIFAQGKAVMDEAGVLVKMNGTIQDITARKMHEEALEHKNDELRKSNHELDKFVYSVSHDLRAPLLSMQGIVEVTEGMTSEELTASHMQMLNASISRLDKFIGDILNYSRNSRMEVKTVNVSFKKILKEITEDLKYMLAENKKLSISMDIEQDAEFHTDESRFRIVLNNLISNAIRYHNPAAAQPMVKIRVKQQGGYSRVEIEDNGIGIPPELQHKVFDMFYRVSEQSNGSGLGLYIVKEAVGKLNGELQLESTVGAGTKFTLNLPNLVNQ